MRKHRHTDAEVAAKLKAADALIAKGKRNPDIAKALGVSAMTYHRWRKTRESSPLAGSLQADRAEADPSSIEQTRRIRELQLENSKFRRLITDLLLEKMSIEEAKHGHHADVPGQFGGKTRDG
jgi:putative transposase